MEISVNNIKLFYEISGEGAPLILLHGNGESHKIYDRFVADLGGRYTTYAIDSRCHGKSQRKLPLSYELMADDIAAFIKELKIDRPTIIGFSDGGIICLLLSIKYPDILGKIIVLGANATPDGLNLKFTRIMKILYKITKSPKLKMMLTQPNITKEQLNAITVPAVIIAGSNDLITNKHTKYIADNIPSAVLNILEGEGHTSYVINSPKLYKILEKYL